MLYIELRNSGIFRVFFQSCNPTPKPWQIRQHRKLSCLSLGTSLRHWQACATLGCMSELMQVSSCLCILYSLLSPSSQMEVVLNLMSSLQSSPLPRTKRFCQGICLEVERKGSKLEGGFWKKTKKPHQICNNKVYRIWESIPGTFLEMTPFGTLAWGSTEAGTDP